MYGDRKHYRSYQSPDDTNFNADQLLTRLVQLITGLLAILLGSGLLIAALSLLTA